VNKRLVSLDVFRGMTIAAMILVNNIEGQTYSQLRHSAWDGLTFADSIFPFFLWIIGVAMVFSFKRRLDQKTDKTKLLLHIFRRSLILFALGLFLNGFPYFNLGTIRIMGVLQRIALCYFVTSIILIFTKVRTQVILLITLILGYVFLLEFVPVPGLGAGQLSLGHNIVQYVDNLLLKDHMLAIDFDPEGIVSTLGAIATVIFGVLTGEFLLASKFNHSKRVLWMGAAAVGLTVVGLVMNIWLLVNKDLWTSSYVVITAGLATGAFALLYFIIEAKEYKKWSTAFTIYGMNAISIYILSSLFTRSLMIIQWQGMSLRDFIYNFYLSVASAQNASLLFAFTHVLIFYGVAYLMFKRGLFIKI